MPINVPWHALISDCIIQMIEPSWHARRFSPPTLSRLLAIGFLRKYNCLLVLQASFSWHDASARAKHSKVLGSPNITTCVHNKTRILGEKGKLRSCHKQPASMRDPSDLKIFPLLLRDDHCAYRASKDQMLPCTHIPE